MKPKLNSLIGSIIALGMLSAACSSSTEGQSETSTAPTSGTGAAVDLSSVQAECSPSYSQDPTAAVDLYLQDPNRVEQGWQLAFVDAMTVLVVQVSGCIPAVGQRCRRIRRWWRSQHRAGGLDWDAGAGQRHRR